MRLSLRLIFLNSVLRCHQTKILKIMSFKWRVKIIFLWVLINWSARVRSAFQLFKIKVNICALNFYKIINARYTIRIFCNLNFRFSYD